MEAGWQKRLQLPDLPTPLELINAAGCFGHLAVVVYDEPKLTIEPWRTG